MRLTYATGYGFCLTLDDGSKRALDLYGDGKMNDDKRMLLEAFNSRRDDDPTELRREALAEERQDRRKDLYERIYAGLVVKSFAEVSLPDLAMHLDSGFVEERCAMLHRVAITAVEQSSPEDLDDE